MYKTFIFVAIMMIRSCDIISLSLRPLKTTSVEHAQSFRSHTAIYPIPRVSESHQHIHHLSPSSHRMKITPQPSSGWNLSSFFVRSSHRDGWIGRLFGEAVIYGRLLCHHAVGALPDDWLLYKNIIVRVHRKWRHYITWTNFLCAIANLHNFEYVTVSDTSGAHVSLSH
jgi:hypothetical protein